MKSLKNMCDYCDEIGGVFSDDELEALPYNHWRKDFEWMVLIIDRPADCAFIPVEALTAAEACLIAINQYRLLKELEDE